MAIARTQYITEAEYTEITGNTTTLQEIYEASELLEYYMRNGKTFDVSSASDNLKKATAYQVKYNDDNLGIDEAYSGGGDEFAIGDYSEKGNSGETGATEYKKLAPKAYRYLMLGNLVNRIL